MNSKHKRRLVLISLLVTGLSVSVGLVLMALQENINLFFTPSQAAMGEVPAAQRFRIGGLVVYDSVEKTKGELTIAFRLSDTVKEVRWNMRVYCRICFAKGRGSSPREGWISRGCSSQTGCWPSMMKIICRPRSKRP